MGARVIDGRGLAAELKEELAVHPVNAGLLAIGRPCYVLSTPAAAFHMLDHYLVGSGRDPTEFYSRSNVVFVGRSNNVGKPALTGNGERGRYRRNWYNIYCICEGERIIR